MAQEWSAGSFEEWIPCQNAEGRVYWYNKTTGQVTWERPVQSGYTHGISAYPHQEPRVNYAQPVPAAQYTTQQTAAYYSQPATTAYAQPETRIIAQRPAPQYPPSSMDYTTSVQQVQQVKYATREVPVTQPYAAARQPSQYIQPPTPQPNSGDQFLDDLAQRLQQMSFTDLERHLSQLGIRYDDMQNKQQMITTIYNAYSTKRSRGEQVRLPQVNANDPSSRRPPGYSSGNDFDNRNKQQSYSDRDGRRNFESRDRDTRKSSVSKEVVNWGAVRQLHDGQWQTRTPTGSVLEKLFTTREEATEWLRQRKRKEESMANNTNNNNNTTKNNNNTTNNNNNNNENNVRTNENYGRSQRRDNRGRDGYNNDRYRNNNNKYNNNDNNYNRRNNNYNNNNSYNNKKRSTGRKVGETVEAKAGRAPSPPAYIAPMPADLWDDDDDDEIVDDMPEHAQQRPVGREILTNQQDQSRFVLTSSVELNSIYQNGFEEWKSSAPWDNEAEGMRLKVSQAFRDISRTAVITQTGVVYTERVDTHSEKRININEDLFFIKTIRYPDKAKFLIRLQHAVEHQLAVALYRANFTRMSGETTPMYVFMAQSSGEEIRIPNGKTITNFTGIVPHVKIINMREVHLELVPAEKSFLTKTVRDLIQRGKPKAYFKDGRALARTTSKLLTVTIVNITEDLSIEYRDPLNDKTVGEMSKIRGCAFTYSDAVVVETSHGLFSSDEIYPAASLNKKEQAARDKQLRKHRYVDRQKAHYEIVVKFHEELLESIRRHAVGLELQEDLICAPCHYLPEVQVKRSNGKEGESIGSKSRHHEWDRLLKKAPAKLKLDSMVVLADGRFREMNSLTKIFRAIGNRRPWIPEPIFHQCNLGELAKVWDSRPQNMINIVSDAPLTQDQYQQYFNSIGAAVTNIKSNGLMTTVQFRTSKLVPHILAVRHTIDGVSCSATPFLRLSKQQKKSFTHILNDLSDTDGIVIFLPGKEGSSQATHLKNRLTMMMNGECGINPCALQFIMASHIRHNSKRSLPILQEALEAGLVPKTGAITFEIESQKCDFDLVIAVDITSVGKLKCASVVATNSPLEGSLSSMTCIVTELPREDCEKLGDLISYDKMTHILNELNCTGKNVLLYRHNACVDSRDLFSNEIQACVDYFDESNFTLIEVTSHTSLRILDVEYPPLHGRQANTEFIITSKITRTYKKVIEYYIRHIAKSNPVRYSILFSTNRELITIDSEVINCARFTHNLTKNYVHHKDGSKFPGPLKYADHVSKWFGSIVKTLGREELPKFHPNAIRPRII